MSNHGLRYAAPDERNEYPGELVLWRNYGGRVDPLEPDLTIESADPRIRIDAQLLSEMGDWRHMIPPARLAVSVQDDLVKVRARNDTVVYRLVAYDVDHDDFLAEWV